MPRKQWRLRGSECDYRTWVNYLSVLRGSGRRFWTKVRRRWFGRWFAHAGSRRFSTVVLVRNHRGEPSRTYVLEPASETLVKNHRQEPLLRTIVDQSNSSSKPDSGFEYTTRPPTMVAATPPRNVHP